MQAFVSTKNGAFIHGQEVMSSTGETFDVVNPATNELIAQVADLSLSQVEEAIYVAQQAQRKWQESLPKERARVLRKWYDLVMQNKEALAELLSKEQGKPLAESVGEIIYGANYIEWFAEEAKRIYGDIIPKDKSYHRLFSIKQPVGVVAAITPWNFPNAMITRKVAPAIAAGCSVVLKPADETPLSALALAKLAQQAGLPDGVFNVVTGRDAVGIGKVLTNSPIVKKLTFTGSTRVGKILMAQCADSIKKVSLELGGNAPTIIFDDADLENAVKATLESKYRNAGQTCVCTNRIYVQSGIYDRFVQRFKECVASFKVGAYDEKDVVIGPLISQEAVKKIQHHIDDALAKGAKLELGGQLSDQGGTFFLPTIISNVNQSMLVAKEETFAPLAPIFKFETEEEVIEYANDTDYGLASYLFTQDVGRMWRVSEKLEYGMVGINEGLISNEMAPFGGVKQSGLGREGSHYGLDDYLEMKYLCMKV